jgi:hypothetical protein
MANLISIFGCKNDKETKYCKEYSFGRKWDGKGCIQYMRTNKMSELTEYVSTSFPQSY